MKNDTTLCACAVVITCTLETKNVEKGHLASLNLTFLRIALDENRFRILKEAGQIYKTLSQIFLFFAPELSYDLSKFSNNLTPFFRL